MMTSQTHFSTSTLFYISSKTLIWIIGSFSRIMPALWLSTLASVAISTGLCHMTLAIGCIERDVIRCNWDSVTSEVRWWGWWRWRFDSLIARFTRMFASFCCHWSLGVVTITIHSRDSLWRHQLIIWMWRRRSTNWFEKMFFLLDVMTRITAIEDDTRDQNPNKESSTTSKDHLRHFRRSDYSKLNFIFWYWCSCISSLYLLFKKTQNQHPISVIFKLT